MKRNIAKTGIVYLMVLFLLAGYIEGIKVEPFAVFAADNTKVPQHSPNIRAGLAALEGNNSPKQGLKNHSSSSWQTDDQKHKAQDHNEEDIVAFSIADLSSLEIIGRNAKDLTEVLSKFPAHTEIGCRG